MSADWWQNFANNFAADLAPLLSLFGEQPTKQFLSETLTFVDIIIFSIAPIGVLTAVVSAIRVGGDPSLRAFIGRAQEGGAYAEAELCSSTSRDVCELYTTGGIARVFGRPKILEIVHDPSKDWESDTAGIYTFEEYSNLDGQTGWTEKKTRPNSGTAAGKDFADHPNLSLNIGIKKLARLWFYLAAALGLFLQGGVLVFAALATYVYPSIFKRDDTQVAVPAFPFTFAGTILLCTGVGLCATVVESSTKERTFKRKKDSKCRLHWIQPGGQVIGDQVFDSFAYSETSDNLLDEYTTSWKSDERTSKLSKDDRTQATKKVLLVWAAIITTCVGFVLQFLGIRTLHSSVSVAQFVVMLVMSTVRALLRTQRLKKSDNQIGESYTLYQCHELDWLAIKLACQENDGDNRRWTWQIVRPFRGICYEAVDLSPRTRDEAGDPPTNTPEASSIHDPLGHPWSELEKAFLKRARLARLTGARSSNFNLIAYSAWDQTMIASRELASSLAKAIEGTMALFYSECTIGSRWKRASKICWSIPCGKDAIGEEPGSPPNLASMLGCIRFTLRRQLGSTVGSWEADKSELEAALGLWLWSIRLKDRVESSGEQVSEEFPDSFLPRSRIVLSHVETVTSAECTSLAKDYTRWHEVSEDSTSSDHTSTTSNEAPDLTPPFPAEHSRPAEANLKLWLGSRRLTLRHTTLKVTSDLFGPSTIVKPLKEYKEETFSVVSPDGLKEETTRPQRRRIFGQYLLPQSATSQTQVRILEVHSQSSLGMMCAQEVFSAFLMSLAPIMHQINGKTSIKKGSDKVYLENQTVSNMIHKFVASGIGSEEDALTCIVPVLHDKCRLVHSMILSESRDAADAYRRRNELVKAEQVLLCALDLSFQAPESNSIPYGPGKYTKYLKEQNLCLLALCELYRWALLGDRHSQLFGLRGVLSICKTHHFKHLSEEVFAYRDAAFIFGYRHKNDPVIRKLSEEIKAEIETSRMSGWIPLYDKIPLHDLLIDDLLMDDLAATLYLLNDRVPNMSPPAIARAARKGWVTVLKTLLELGADPEEIDRDGLNYLHYASEAISDPEIFLKVVGNHGYLLDRMDKFGRTSLHLAAGADHKEITRILMDQFFLDPYQWDLSMKSSFDQALSQRHSKTLAFLVSKMVQGLELSSTNVIWDTFMQIATQIAASEDRIFLDKFLKYLDKVGSDTANGDIKKVLVGLHNTCATFFQEFAKVRCLEFNVLQRIFYEHFGHNPTSSSNIALSYRVEINNIPLTPFLENPEKIVSLDDTGRSCLHYAVKSRDERMVQQLLDAIPDVNSANINVEDKTGKTPLSYAFGIKNMELTSLFLKHRAGIHKLPLDGGAIAATAINDTDGDYSLYFQDQGLRIREMSIRNLESGRKMSLSLEIAVAKEFSPLAVIKRKGVDSRIRVYYFSETNDLCEAIKTGNSWSDGTLSRQRINVYRRSSLAAVQPGDGMLRVFYQGDLQEIRSIDGYQWQGPTRIREIPFRASFTVLTTPEAVTRIIFQGEMALEEVYENHTENNTEWSHGVIKVTLSMGFKVGSIAASSLPSRKIFWQDFSRQFHETTLTDDGHWEDHTENEFVRTDLRDQKTNFMRGRVQTQLAVIGSEPILFYQQSHGSIFEVSKEGGSWRYGRMVISAYHS